MSGVRREGGAIRKSGSLDPGANAERREPGVAAQRARPGFRLDDPALAPDTGGMATNRVEISLYAALDALPEGLTGEIVDGQMHATPRPAPPHSLVSSSPGGELQVPFQRGRGDVRTH